MKSAKSTSHENDIERAALRGKREELFDLLYPLAQRAAGVRSASAMAGYLDNDFDRKDLEQEALLEVWEALDRYDDSRASLRTFVERIVFNKVVSVLRRAKAKKRTRDAGYGTLESPRFFVTVELHLDVEKVMATLERRERQVARLLHEYSPADIARALAVSRASVYRSIDRIRDAFADAGLR